MPTTELKMLQYESKQLTTRMARLAEIQNNCLDSFDWVGYEEASEKQNKLHIQWMAIQDQIIELVQTSLKQSN